MKQHRHNYFSFETAGGYATAGFNIYQSKNGSIILALANAHTVLSCKQLGELFIDLYSLKDFDHDLFLLFYQTQIT